MSATRAQPSLNAADLLHAARREPAELDREHARSASARPRTPAWRTRARRAVEMRLSRQRLRLRAATAPSSTPRPTDSANTVSISSSVGPSRLRISSATRHAVAERVAEVEREDLLEVDDQLDVERLVEAELLAQLRHVFGRRRTRFAGEHVGRVAGREMEQREVQDDDGEDRRDRERQAAQRRTAVPFRSTAPRRRSVTVATWRARPGRTTRRGRAG